MGFFKFIRQNKNARKPEEQKNVIKHIPVSQTPVFQDTAKPENQTPPPLPENKKKPKDDVCDFFHVNIYNIFIHEPVFVKKNKAGEKFTLNLSKPELATFNRVDIFRHENGTYDLLFTGHETQIKTDLTDFIRYCTGVLGPDFMQKKELSQEDVRDMKLGIFSRIWHNRVRIENIHFRFSLTLYNISPRLPG